MSETKTANVRHPLRAIFSKELRETLPWALAAMTLVAGVLVFALFNARDDLDRSGIGLHHEDVQAMYVVAVALAGFALGVLGWVFDVSGGRWGLMLQRPATRRQWLVGKLAVGLGGYFVATLLPLLCAALWCRMPGNVAGPFSWWMLGPGVVDALSGGVAYLAGALLMVRPARWWGSRLLVLPGAGYLMAMVFVVPWLGGALIWMGIGWGVYLTVLGSQFLDRRRAELRWVGRVATGLVVLPGIYFVGVLVFMLTAAVFSPVHRPSPFSPGVLEDGRAVLVDQWGNEVRSVVDAEGNQIEGVGLARGKDLDPAKTLAHAAYLSRGQQVRRWRSLPQIYGLLRDGRLGGLTAWYIDHREGRFVGFDVKQKLPVAQLTPTGFEAWTPKPATRFGAGLTSLGWSGDVYVYDGAVYGVFWNEKIRFVLYRSPEHEELPEVLACVPLRDSSAWAIWLGQRLMLVRYDSVNTPLADTTLVTTFDRRLPAAIAVQRDGFRLFNLKSRGWVLAEARGSTAFHWSPSGDNESSFAMLEAPAPPVVELGALSGAVWVLVVPPAASVVAWAVLGSEAVASSSPAGTWVGGVVLVAVAMLSALLAGGLYRRRAGRAGYGVAVWSVLGLLLGPMALALQLCAESPASPVRCPECGRQRGASSGACPRCAAAFTPPARIGTELFA